MSIPFDLKITNIDGESHNYIIDQSSQAEGPIEHAGTNPQVPMNLGFGTPAQAGGVYDVRDSDGDKAITHLDWTGGAGQQSLDSATSVPNMFLDSKNIEISIANQIRLNRPLVATHQENISGPAFYAQGYFWLASLDGTLKYTTDPQNTWANWTAASGITSTGPISDWCSDGDRVYVCIPSGASYSIYANTAAAPGTFGKFGSTGETAAIRHIAICGGQLYAATVAGAGVVNSIGSSPTGVYTKKTPDFMDQTMTSVALVSAGNAIYWVVCKQAKAYVYELTAEPGATTTTVTQYVELPDGFVATCATGYLSSIYIGGYWESREDGVGKGGVYVGSDANVYPLFEIGETPERTKVPSSTDNDNRIWAVTAAEKDLYFLTSRGLYRWDIDSGGYSHVSDIVGCGASTLTETWDSGSIYSWDGTEHANPDSPHYQFPEGYTRTHEDLLPHGDTPTWTYTGGHAKMTFDSSHSGRCVIKGSPTMSNTDGTTIGIKFGPDFSGMPNAYSSEHPLVVYIRDGVRQCKVSFYLWPGSNAGAKIHTWWYNPATEQYEWSTAATQDVQVLDWDEFMGYKYNYHYDTVTYNTGQQSVYGSPTSEWTITLQGTRCTVSVDSTSAHTDLTKATTDSDELEFRFFGINNTTPIVPDIDYILFNSQGATPSKGITDTIFKPSVAYSKGVFLLPYADPTYAQQLTVSGAGTISVEAGTDSHIQTTTDHGISGSTQMVYISGSNSTPTVDGVRVATYVDHDTFSVPVDVTVAGTAATVYYNHEVGWHTTDTDAFATEGYMMQSPTTFHTGTLAKDFRKLEVTHSMMPEDCSLLLQFWVDGNSYMANGISTGTSTSFVLNVKGYSIRTKLTVIGSGTDTPTIYSYNVLWNFVKTQRHSYILDCRPRAGGRWNEDPEEAIKFLFVTADESALFEDRYAGKYLGTIENVQFSQAPHSLVEKPCGTVKIVVREGA